MAGQYTEKEAEQELKKAKKIAPPDAVKQSALRAARSVEEHDQELLGVDDLKKDDKEFQQEAKYAGKKMLDKNLWYLESKKTKPKKKDKKKK